jgi:putative alpha-1,2-mannosidase
MEDGKKFIIKANHNSKSNVYIQHATLNGRSYSHNWITYQDIVNGGTLKLSMGTHPNKHRGIQRKDRPFSLSKNK